MRVLQHLGVAVLAVASSIACGDSFTSGAAGGSGGAGSGGAPGGTGGGGVAGAGGSGGTEDCSPLNTPVEVLAQGQPEPYSVAVDDVFVYWSSRISGAVRRIPKDLSDVTTTVASGQNGVAGIAVDDGFVYWANRLSNGGALMRQAKTAGASPEVLVDGLLGATWVVLDGPRIFWSEPTGGRIVSANKDGSDLKVIAASQNQPQHLAVDEQHVYWIRYVNAAAQTRQIVRMAKDGTGEQVSVVGSADAPGTTHLALDAQFLYWNGVDADTGAVRRRSGGLPVELVEPGPKRCGPVVLDATHAYWVSQEGTADEATLARFPKSGGCIRALATTTGRTISMAMDAGAVYWLDWDGGRVLRAALAP